MGGKIRQKSFRINPVDRLGRNIDPVVLAAAEEISQRAVEYGEKLLRDPALATSLLEESAAIVSRAIRTKSQSSGSSVRNLHAYLFRTFIRLVDKAKRKEFSLLNAMRAGPATYSNRTDVSKDFQLKVLVDEFLTRCDPVFRDMFYRRGQGFSWKEIGDIYGISSHAAESRFSQALQRVRKRLGTTK